ncbi:cytochrome P450 [Diaporthe eres]|nr:cytochrome P450 [Diaporthe eres]
MTLLPLAAISFTPFTHIQSGLSWKYIAARKTGLPVVTSLTNPTGALWELIKNIFLSYLTLFPGNVGQNARLNVFGWQFRAKHTAHQRLGNAFVQVTPSHNIVNIAGPDLVQQVIQRMDDFPKPRQIDRNATFEFRLGRDKLTMMIRAS